ncbi:MAG: DUF92 domain-containing protein [Bacteroidota bacterium]
MNSQILVGLIFAAIIAPISYRLRLLTIGGAIAEFILGFVLLGLGGWQWTVPMLAFFIFSIALSRFGKARKQYLRSVFDKSSIRDAWQVLANGGVAGIIILLNTFASADISFVAYLGAIAAATADTWGTELGTISSSLPRLITTFKRVERGRSGAISAAGTLAGLLGASVIYLTGLAWIESGYYGRALCAVVAGGVAGSLADSILGATAQIQYQCSACGAIVERKTHCGLKTGRISGFFWLSNDAVNFFSSVAGAFVSGLTATLFA